MNILIPDSWLREHLKTKATTKQIARYLTLCSQSVEKIHRKNGDSIYDIEITTNRPDCLSVYGIARELAVILPQFGISARLSPIKEVKNNFPPIKKSLPLKVIIKNKTLCPRFTAVIFKNVKIKTSPKIVQERLEKSGVRALNNVVDISNYLMLELGQPMHTFDYDKIKNNQMILRESKKDEKIITLDKQTRDLPQGTIIIEDGQSRIIDLCGIMGGANSAVDEKTERVLLFVQTYQPMRIRQTCQNLAFHTDAASRFERGVESEGVIPAIKKATAMFQKLTGGQVASKLIDIYPQPPKPKTVKVAINQIQKILDLEINKTEIIKILNSLGFKLKNESKNVLAFSVPYWRYEDINIPEDLIEEVARIYGYHRLAANLPENLTSQTSTNPIFQWEQKAKTALCFWGFNETVSYSMISKSWLKKTHLNPNEHLQIANPLNKDNVYLRRSLIPSLLETLAKNQALNKKIKIFELANIYLAQKKNQLPQEIPTLTAALTGNDFYKVKGIVETLLSLLGISDFKFEPYILKKTIFGKIFHPGRTAEIMVKNDSLGIIGEINPQISRLFEIKGRVIAFDLDFNQLLKYSQPYQKYIPIPKYPGIIEDLSFVIPEKTLVGELIQSIKQTSSAIQSVELIDSYRDTRTIRITYQSPKKTLRDKEVKKIREKIIQKVKTKFNVKLKT